MERTRRLVGWLVLLVLICAPAQSQGQVCGEEILSIGGCEMRPVQVLARKAAAANTFPQSVGIEKWSGCLAAYYFAVDATNPGLGQVMTCIDRSGNGRTATQSTDANKPTIGATGITLGSTKGMVSTIPFSDAGRQMTIIARYYPVADDSTGRSILAAQGANFSQANLAYSLSSARYLEVYNNRLSSNQGSANTKFYWCVGQVKDSGTCYVTLDGTKVTRGSGGGLADTSLTTFTCGWVINANYSAGILSHVFVFNRILTAGEEAIINGLN